LRFLPPPPRTAAPSPYPAPSLEGVPEYPIDIDLRPPDGRIAIAGTADQPEFIVSVNKAFRDVRFDVVEPKPRENAVTVSAHGGFTD
jgi:hypothetical protein